MTRVKETTGMVRSVQNISTIKKCGERSAQLQLLNTMARGTKSRDTSIGTTALTPTIVPGSATQSTTVREFMTCVTATFITATRNANRSVSTKNVWLNTVSMTLPQPRLKSLFNQLIAQHSLMPCTARQDKISTL